MESNSIQFSPSHGWTACWLNAEVDGTFFAEVLSGNQSMLLNSESATAAARNIKLTRGSILTTAPPTLKIFTPPGNEFFFSFAGPTVCNAYHSYTTNCSVSVQCNYYSGINLRFSADQYVSCDVVAETDEIFFITT